ncbi:MAG: hypothetical protein K0R40_4242 [Burkholderiales bacterium]|nr:hypothetical protein [Burkholderiales bacterium]
MDRQQLASLARLPWSSLLLAALIALLPGCATRLEAPGLRFQTSAIGTDGTVLAFKDLRPGDIILSSAPAEEDMAFVLRHPGLSDEQAARMAEYALGQTGTAFSYFGVTLQAPFSLSRRLCELPLVPSALRDACLRGLGLVHYLASSETRFFCSQLVLQAYARAGTPLTSADPRMIAPADILHMREGDVPSVRIRQPLRVVGHLKHAPFAVAAR